LKISNIFKIKKISKKNSDLQTKKNLDSKSKPWWVEPKLTSKNIFWRKIP